MLKIIFHFKTFQRSYLSLLIVLSLTGLIWHISKKSFLNYHSLLFRSYTQVLEHEIVERMHLYINTLVQTKGLFAVSENINLLDFHDYVQQIKIFKFYPGIQGIGYAKVLSPGEKEKHILEVRRYADIGPQYQIYKNYSIWPNKKDSLDSTILYISPIDWRNQRAIGYDMLKEPTRRKSMIRAALSGEPTLSDKIILVQETHNNVQPGFLIYVPLFHTKKPPEDIENRLQALKGFIYSPFRAHDFFQSFFQNQEKIKLILNMAVYSGNKLKNENLLYRHGEIFYHSSAFFQQSVITIAGKEWTFVFSTRPEQIGFQAQYTLQGIIIVGLIIGVILFWQLINAQKHTQIESLLLEETRKQKRKFRILAEQAPVGIYQAGPQGECLFVNRHWLNFSGLSEEEVKVDGWNKAIHPDDFPRVQKEWQKAKLENQDFCSEFRFRTPTGKVTFLRGEALMMKNEQGQLLGHLGTITDITPLKMTEENLSNALKVREEFLSVASHELKTPLTSLKMRLQINQRSLRRGEMHTHSQQEKNVELALIQVKRLTELVDDLLDVSRIQGKKMNYREESTDLNALILEISERFSEELQQANCQLQLDLQSEVVGWWDKMRVDQVLTNLISNAIKYAPRHPIGISLETRSKVQSNGTIACAQIRVTDNGGGIPLEDRERIFLRFERAISNDNRSGLGLGLYICKEIIVHYGGSLRVEENTPRGAIFIVELPLNFPT